MGSIGRVEICHVPFQIGRIIETFDRTIHSMRTLSRKTAAKLLKGFGEKEGNIGPVYPAAINAGPSYYDCV